MSHRVHTHNDGQKDRMTNLLISPMFTMFILAEITEAVSSSGLVDSGGGLVVDCH